MIARSTEYQKEVILTVFDLTVTDLIRRYGFRFSIAAILSIAPIIIYKCYIDYSILSFPLIIIIITAFAISVWRYLIYVSIGIETFAFIDTSYRSLYPNPFRRFIILSRLIILHVIFSIVQNIVLPLLKEFYNITHILSKHSRNLRKRESA